MKSFDFTALFGGLEGIRTLDLSDANRTLSQLSYKPEYEIFPDFWARFKLCSLSQLSYTRTPNLLDIAMPHFLLLPGYHQY